MDIIERLPELCRLLRDAQLSRPEANMFLRRKAAEEIETIVEIVTDARLITNWHDQHSWRKRHGLKPYCETT